MEQATALFSWNFTISPGYNKILLPLPVKIPRGCLILMTQNPNATNVALDTSKSANYSDMIWATNLNKIDNAKNYRFYFQTLTNFTSYVNTFTIVHLYSSVGTYTISFLFTSSNQIFKQTALITDCKLIK